MDKKLIVTLRAPEEAQTVREAGCEVLAEYPSSLLVRCTEAQHEALREAGLETAEVPAPEVRVSGAAFAFDAAVEANEAAPVAFDAERTAYYLVRLAGPPQAAWRRQIEALGAKIHGSLQGFVLLIGALPARTEALRELTWVEAVTPYRAAMKVAPQLRPDVEGRALTAADLTRMEAANGAADSAEGAEAADEAVQVEINVFPGESASAVAAQVRRAGGAVIAETEHTVQATVAPSAVTALAAEQGVQSILPFAFPELHNDVATPVMGAPADRTFGSHTLQGTGEIVAVADSGLDTGDATTAHADFAGRIAGLVSLPTDDALAPWTNDPPSSDDGAADANSGHGTHVAGSVLGSGAAATAAGSATVPQGTAPAARLFFQAHEQSVNWKPLSQLDAEGRAPFTPRNQWPPRTVGLYGLPQDLSNLFTPAYAAGARLHTNSWGAPVAGVYNARSRQVDQFMWNNRDMLVLFSAGNSGNDFDGDGVIDVDSIGAPGTAKNCLTVGASENDRPNGSTPAPGGDLNWNQWRNPNGTLRFPNLGPAGHVSDDVEGMAAFSSRGPTDDGRIKPDVVAPGTNVLSTRSSAAGANPLWGDLAATDPLSGLYNWSGGTSMSTPLVAGAAALIRQHLVQQRGHVQDGVKPSGALVKAFLVNGAVPMGGQFMGEIGAVPNNVCGFGRVNLTEALVPGALEQALFADEPDYAVETGEIRSFEVQVVSAADPLKATLVWTDAPSPANVGTLQNTLYLQVVQPDGTVIDGDVTPFPTATNNVQQVLINAPAPGTYTIRVRGVAVGQQAPGAAPGANPRQDFALVVSNGMGFSTQPVSIAQAIDTTGSMGTFGYLAPAQERARQLVDFMRANDKVSITEFSQRPSEPADARTPYPLRLLGSFAPDWTGAHAAIGGLTAGGMTPIGAGLAEAWNQLSAEPATRPRAIVLLSDGLNNRPPDPATVLPSIPSDVPIFAIALGPAGSVPTLQSIAGSRPNGGYYAVQSDEDVHRLHEVYAQVQALAAGAALVGLDSDAVESHEEQGHEMPIEPGVEEATFALSWDEGANAEPLELIALGPDGQRYDATAEATAEQHGRSYHLVRVAVPEAGRWRLLVRNRGARQAVRYTLSGAARASLKLSAAVRSLEEQRLIVQARLRRGTEPWDEARVVARLILPTRSREEILERFGDEIREVRLPDEVQEEGLSDEQILLLKESVFARRFAEERGGLYGRKTFEVELVPEGEGRWMAEVPLPAPGAVHVEVLAQGEIEGVAWERRATQSAHVEAPRRKPRRKLRIGKIFTRRNRRWKHVIIGVRVRRPDGTPATPKDRVRVRAVVRQNGHEIAADALDYYGRGDYFIWRLPKSDVHNGDEANVSVEVHQTELVVTETATDAAHVAL